MFIIALGWAIFHGQMQFDIIINENKSLQPITLLVVFILAVVASSLLEDFEQALKTWLISIVFSIIITLLLIVIPIAFGVLASEFAPLIIVGSIQPMATSLVLTTPINLLGCFLGQVFRNQLVKYYRYP